jgi:hypothetical protein
MGRHVISVTGDDWFFLQLHSGSPTPKYQDHPHPSLHGFIMSTATPAAQGDEPKADIQDVNHLEQVAGDIDAAKIANFVIDNSGEVSRYADLKQFWRAMAISFACGVCAMGDGYQYKMPGNIVALQGFIMQMGSKNAAGKWVLDSQHVAAWGGKWCTTSDSRIYRY